MKLALLLGSKIVNEQYSVFEVVIWFHKLLVDTKKLKEILNATLKKIGR